MEDVLTAISESLGAVADKLGELDTRMMEMHADIRDLRELMLEHIKDSEIHAGVLSDAR